MRGRSWRVLGALGLAVALGAGVYVATRSTPEETPRLETITPSRGTIVAKVTATGTLSALVTVQVGSQVSGRIQHLYADFNSPVTKGMVLARLDPQLFEAALAQARANHAAARAGVVRAEAEAQDAERKAERARSLVEKSFVARAEADTAASTAVAARAQVEAARASLLQAEATLQQARINLGYTTIVSPIDGVVISRNVDVGQTVAASLQAPVLFQIAEDLRRMQVDTSVAEADIGHLRPDMPARFTVDAFPGREFEGMVRQIRNAATTVQNVVTYDAVVDCSNETLELRPGMTANVTFVIAERQDVLRIPNAALRFRPAKPPAGVNGVDEPESRRAGERALWVRAGEDRARRVVRVGVTDGRFTEVLEGLAEGDEVVVAETEPPKPKRRRAPGML